MSIQAIIANELVRDESSVWMLKRRTDFAYSEGAAAEKYLEMALRNSRDLSTSSSELDRYIKDWPSEYHLSSKRAQLLSGFVFDRSLRVLEVGCGCGAITRYLGETFDDVVSVEGSIVRARLARARTRDLPGVTIVCAPFQEIDFVRKFDIVFCIGVYEYSSSFVDATDPHDAVLRYFSDVLAPDGLVVIAIENQFGLKYFGACREDHLGVKFEGLEGYHSDLGKVRTFGRNELDRDLRRYFSAVEFYYPYPDYKLPDCVLTEKFLVSGHAGELVAQTKSRDYSGATDTSLDEGLVALELARNHMLPYFANSFLVLAGKRDLNHAAFRQLGILFSAKRLERFRTTTRILGEPGGRIVASKRAVMRSAAPSGRLALVDVDSPWVGSHSLHTIVYLRSRSRNAKLSDIFAPCSAWIRFLQERATTREYVHYIPGELVDCTWSNVYSTTDGQAIVDQEWVWAQPIRLNVVVIRAIYVFLARVEDMGRVPKILRVARGKALVRAIAETFGVSLANEDFAEFIALESELQSLVWGLKKQHVALLLRWFLLDRFSLALTKAAKRRLAHAWQRLVGKATLYIGQ
jgi:SAM-dependent methyltransferase